MASLPQLTLAQGHYPSFLEIRGLHFKISIVLDASDISVTESVLRQQQAEQLVKACNSHDQLVAALRACAYADSGTRDQAVDHARELLVELGVAGA